MNDEPRQTLCKLIAQYGRSLSEDPRRCGALLKDHCGQYKREIFVLVNALENRVAEELLKASTGVPVVLLLSRLTKRLEDELGLAETAARWAVETWALALGVIDQPMPASAPTPAQPVSPISQASPTPAVVASSIPSTGGKLQFPKFSVGWVKFGIKVQAAVGEIAVPKSQTVELKVSEDVTDFSFLLSCDPNGVIRDLNLSRCENFSDQGLKNLKNLTNLQFLNLSNCGIGVQGYELFELKNLIGLDLSGCNYFQNEGLAHISKITTLRSLNLNMTEPYGSNIFITDPRLEHLGKLIHLERLGLSGCTKITGPGVLAHLGHMTQLKSLDLSQCDNVSPTRLQELKQMLPNTRVLP